jgi:hypothetical protein
MFHFPSAPNFIPVRYFDKLLTVFCDGPLLESLAVQSIKSDYAFESIFEGLEEQEEQEDFDERARAGVAVGHALGEPEEDELDEAQADPQPQIDLFA